MEKYSKKILICAVLLLVAVVFALPIADLASAPATHGALIASIDDKVATVMKLTSSCTVASVGISAIPGDTASPIAQKLADLSFYFLLILCVLYTEKYMLTVIGLAAFRVLIPCACVLGMASLFSAARGCRKLAVRLVVLALALYVAIPAAIGLSDFVYRNYETSFASTMESAEQLTQETNQLTQADGDRNIISSILNQLSETALSLSNKAANILSRFVETVAVLIVTSCVLPLLGLAFILWIVKLLTGSDAFGNLIRIAEYPRRRKAVEE